MFSCICFTVCFAVEFGRQLAITVTSHMALFGSSQERADMSG